MSLLSKQKELEPSDSRTTHPDSHLTPRDQTYSNVCSHTVNWGIWVSFEGVKRWWAEFNISDKSMNETVRTNLLWQHTLVKTPFSSTVFTETCFTVNRQTWFQPRETFGLQSMWIFVQFLLYWIDGDVSAFFSIFLIIFFLPQSRCVTEVCAHCAVHL